MDIEVYFLLMSQDAYEKSQSPAKELIAAKKSKAPTLADVANHVGVSKAAASAVLNNTRSQIRVSQATRERLLQAAQELQYQPNVLARALLQKKTNVIGFYSDEGRVFDPRYPFFGAILSGLFRGCEEHEKNLLVHGVFHNRSEEDIFLELLNGQIDGLVFYTRRSGTPLLNRLTESRLPVITIVDEVQGLPCVTVDNFEGGRLLARHLGEKGFRRAFFRVSRELMQPSIEQRLAGFQEEAQNYNMDVTLHWFRLECPDEEEAEILLSPQRRPQVIVAFNDLTADILVEFYNRHGLCVPQDIAITGFDGFMPVTRPAMRLTTVHCPWEEVAHTAISKLVAQINGAEVPRLTRLPVALLQGDTT